MQTDFKVWIRF